MVEGDPTEPAKAASPMDDIRQRFRSVQEAEGRPDRARYTSALKGFLA